MEHSRVMHRLALPQLLGLVDRYLRSHQVATNFVQKADCRQEGHREVVGLEPEAGASWRQWQGWSQQQLHQ